MWTKICKEKEDLKRKQIRKHFEDAYLNLPIWAPNTKQEMNNVEEKILSQEKFKPQRSKFI